MNVKATYNRTSQQFTINGSSYKISEKAANAWVDRMVNAGTRVMFAFID